MLLLEIEKLTNIVLGGVFTDGEFVDLPETSYSMRVSDPSLSDSIWNSLTNGGCVSVVNKVFTIEPVTPVVPEVPKTAEQLLIEQQQRDIESLMLVVTDLYEKVYAEGGS